MLKVESKTEVTWRWLEAELEGRAVPDFLVLIGFGDGELLDALDKYAPGRRVLALEPDPGRAAAFRARRGTDAWLSSGRLVYLADPAYAGADEAWRIFPTSGEEPIVLVHPDLELGAGVARASQVLKKILFGVEANAEARRKFAPRYLLNSIRNIPAIVRGADIRALTARYRGVPAIIAAAGPSLDAAVEDLRHVHDRGLLIAADTALRPLLANGIAPALVVGLDPSEANLRHFRSLPQCRDTWLVAESALDPRAVAPFDGRTFWFRVSNHHPWPFLRALGLEVGQIDVWGSVLTAAFQTAVLAGCDPIVIVGGDLAFTNGQPYARGTTYEFDWAWAVASGRDLPGVWQAHIDRQEIVRVTDVYGQPTLSTGSLVSFRDWLVARTARSGRTVVNASRAGILAGAGIEQRGLLETLAGALTVPAPGLCARPRPASEGARLVRGLREARGAVDGSTHAHPVAEWREFSGGGFEADRVGAALQEAISALDGNTARSGSTSSQWSQLDEPLARVLLMGLPEGVASLRAALAGLEPAGATPLAPDRPAILVQALRLLESIHDETDRSEIFPSSLWIDGAGTPASAKYMWPDALRWAVVSFEGLLGRAWTTSAGVSLPAPSFFDAAVAPRDTAVPGTAPPEVFHGAAACGILASQWTQCAAGLTAQERETLGASLEGRTALDLLQSRSGNPAHARRLTGFLRDHQGRAIAFVSPRVLTDEGMARSIVQYSGERGVVCVRPYDSSSAVISASGEWSVHQTWPMPIVGEMPFGDSGAVAWSNGLSRWPETAVNPARVAFRCTLFDTPEVEPLTVRPTLGTWWQDRLYWSCYPAPVDSWVGVASWAPGEPSRREADGLILYGLRPSADGLALHPCSFDKDRGYTRRPLTDGWVLTPASRLESVPLGPLGARPSSASSGGWVATACTEADLLEFAHADGRRVLMTCYYPMQLAWVGRSLVVSTVERDVLFFDGLLDVLNAVEDPE